MSGHALHVAAHELDALEAFVHACVQQLPRLTPVAGFSASVRGPVGPVGPVGPAGHGSPAGHGAAASSSAQLPARCAAYHTTCAAMLKQALAALAPLSPRLARLVAQVWDLASLNVFALLQLAQAALDESAALLAQSERSARFQAERRAQEAERAARADRERELLRAEAQALRAELHTTRQRANRLAVEKTQLRRVLAGLLDGPLEAPAAAAGGGGAPAGGSRVVLEFEEDVAAVGVAEEQALYGVDGAALEAVELAHPLERAAADLDQVLAALAAGDARHVAVLNSMDRFINSHAVGLLWRYGSAEQQHQLMARMLRSRHAATQTTDAATAAVARRGSLRVPQGVDAEPDSDDDEQDSDDEDAGADALASGGVSGHAALVTRARAIPQTLRAQLDSRPRVHRVLELRDAARLVLALLVDKLDADAAAVRARQPRAALHRFLKQAFLVRYGVASLADYHLMELVKSALFHHERLRRAAVASAAATPGDSSTDALLVALTPADRPHHADADAVRLALFARLCELVPFELPASDAGGQLPGSPAAGNLFTTALHALVDLLGDVVELDAAVASLNDVEHLDGRWWCPLSRAALLLGHHLAFLGRDALVAVAARLQALSGPVPGSAPRDAEVVVEVDVLLALFVSAWLEHDQQLTSKLRDGFRRQLMLISPLALGQSAGKAGSGSAGARKRRPTVMVPAGEADEDAASVSASVSVAPPIETLMRVFAGLPDESVAPTVLEELRAALLTLMDAKQQQQQQQQQPARGRRATKKTPSVMHLAGANVCIGGVSEKEFVFHALEVLRVRRVCYGLRTNGRRLVRRRRALGGHDHDEDADEGDDGECDGSPALWTTEEEALVSVAPGALKPGLTRREW